MLRLLGIDERRLRLKWISASEGAMFAEEIHAFVQLLKELGKIIIATETHEKMRNLIFVFVSDNTSHM